MNVLQAPVEVVAGGQALQTGQLHDLHSQVEVAAEGQVLQAAGQLHVLQAPVEVVAGGHHLAALPTAASTVSKAVALLRV
jgi:hypothetical protein